MEKPEKEGKETNKKQTTGGIMIVDDSPDNLRLLISILKRKGFHVRPVRHPTILFSAVYSQPPDLILLDIQMPEMNGYEVCRKLKADARTQHIPVIFLSAMTAREDKEKAFAAGGADYISKPLMVEEVLARVQSHLSPSSKTPVTSGEDNRDARTRSAGTGRDSHRQRRAPGAIR